MIEKILKEIADLDAKKPILANNFCSEKFKQYKKLLSDAEQIVDCINNINEYIEKCNLSEDLKINFSTDSIIDLSEFSKISNAEIFKLFASVSENIKSLAKISDYKSLDVEIDGLTSKIQRLSGLVGYLRNELSKIEESETRKYNKNRNKILDELKKEINKKQAEENEIKNELSKFLNNYDLSKDFILYRAKQNKTEEELAKKISFELPELTRYKSHNFSNPQFHNLLFLNANAKDREISAVLEELFLRLFFFFDARMIQIQPVGFVPLQLNAFLSSVKVGDYLPIRPSILDEKNFENFLAWVYMEVTNRINKYRKTGCQDIYEYNRANTDNLDKAIVIFLKDYEVVKNKVCDMQIKNLIDSECYLYGVYFIATSKFDEKDKSKLYLQAKENNFTVFDIDKNGTIYLEENEVSFDLYDDNIRDLFSSKVEAIGKD